MRFCGATPRRCYSFPCDTVSLWLSVTAIRIAGHPPTVVSLLPREPPHGKGSVSHRKPFYLKELFDGRDDFVLAQNRNDPANAVLNRPRLLHPALLKCGVHGFEIWQHDIVCGSDARVGSRRQSAEQCFIRPVDQVNLAVRHIQQPYHLKIVGARPLDRCDVLYRKDPGNQLRRHGDAAARQKINHDRDIHRSSQGLVILVDILFRVGKIKWRNGGDCIDSSFLRVFGQLNAITGIHSGNMIDDRRTAVNLVNTYFTHRHTRVLLEDKPLTCTAANVKAIPPPVAAPIPIRSRVACSRSAPVSSSGVTSAGRIPL